MAKRIILRRWIVFSAYIKMLLAKTRLQKDLEVNGMEDLVQDLLEHRDIRVLKPDLGLLVLEDDFAVVFLNRIPHEYE